jgi:hypothetical protein
VGGVKGGGGGGRSNWGFRRGVFSDTGSRSWDDVGNVEEGRFFLYIKMPMKRPRIAAKMIYWGLRAETKGIGPGGEEGEERTGILEEDENRNG